MMGHKCPAFLGKTTNNKPMNFISTTEAVDGRELQPGGVCVTVNLVVEHWWFFW
tara:strand:- start:8690 stop:8851 length:162 start_codon:yes stop_codon:yes gene_type:complete